VRNPPGFLPTPHNMLVGEAGELRMGKAQNIYDKLVESTKIFKPTVKSASNVQAIEEFL
jgi:hypothetical protein